LNKRFAQNKKGVSTIIGAIFFVLILLGGFSMIVWEITEYDNYLQVVNDRNRLDWEKQNEIIEIESVYVLDESLNISVTNNGAVAAHLVDLWVTEHSDTIVNWHNLFQIDYYVNSGNTTMNIDRGLVECNPDLIYTVKIVTERGNIAVATYSWELTLPSVTWSDLAQGFGSIVIDFRSFRYFTYDGDTLQPWPDGNIGFRVDTSLPVAYGALFKNLDPYIETLVLDSESNICLIYRKGGGGGSFHWKRWYIVNVDSYTGTITSTSRGSYAPISLGYGEPKFIVFASANDLEEDDFSEQSTPSDEQLCPINLMVFGEIDSQPYSQNIPFVSISFED
jgi:hypothetical protein